MPVLDEQVVTFEDDPQRYRNDGEKHKLAAMRGEPRRATQPEDEAVEQEDIARPGERRVPRPERFDMREHRPFRQRQERESKPKARGKSHT